MRMHQLRIKGKTEEASFYEELQQVFYHLPMDHTKIMLVNLMLHWRQNIFKNQRSGMTGDMKTAVLMVSE
jgi:hypothetical protein